MMCTRVPTLFRIQLGCGMRVLTTLRIQIVLCITLCQQQQKRVVCAIAQSIRIHVVFGMAHERECT